MIMWQELFFPMPDFPPLPDIPSYEEFAESKRRKLLSHIDLTWLERDEYQTKRNSELAES